MDAVTPASAREILLLSAEDNDFYSRHFFPKTVRQPSPDFHYSAWAELEDPSARYVDVMIFRGGAKTSLLRLFTSKRVAFAISRTILFVGESQDAAKRSVRWLKRQVLFNKKWTSFFNLRLGEKKTDEWLEIFHGVDEVPITILAVGITGQTRGINLDDFRPDLIIVDDPCDEENTNTPEQRKKTSDIFFGALAKSLAPPTEAESAKMVLLQTPLKAEDLISMCQKDSQWRSLTFGCFNNQGESRWPERYPTAWLLQEKEAHIKRNQLALWLREMECKIVSEETSAFKPHWLKYYIDLPERLVTFLYIDPVPPPSDAQIAKGLRDKDYEVIAVVGYSQGKYYLCEYTFQKGHEPEWTIAEFWRLVDKWKPRKWKAETVQYQRTLKWIIDQSMRVRGRYIQWSEPVADRRKKSYRIIDNLTSITSNGAFYISDTHKEFIEQFCSYPDISHDDILESVAEAAKMAQEDACVIEGDYDELDSEELPALGMVRGHAP